MLVAAKATHIFFSAKNITVFAILQDRSFKVVLAYNFVKFWTSSRKYGASQSSG